MRILVAVPSRHGHVAAHPEHQKARDHMLKVGLEIGVKHSIDFRYLEGCSLVPWARNALAAFAVAMRYDYVFWVDDDIWWRPEDVAEGIKSDLPVAAFPYFQKPRIDEMRPVSTLNYYTLDGEPMVDPDKDWRQIAMAGTGALLVKTEVLRAMQRVRPRYESDALDQIVFPNIQINEHLFDYFPVGVQSIDGRDVYVGEDFGFCRVADAVGYPVMMYCRSVIAHMRGQVGAVCDYLKLRKLVREGAIKEAPPMSV